MCIVQHTCKCLVLTSLTIILVVGTVIRGQDTLPSLGRICEGLHEVEEKLQFLRIKYSYSTSDYVHGRLVKIVGQAHYAHWLKDRKDYPRMPLFIDLTSHWIEPNTMAKEPYLSVLYAWDGKVGKTLIRTALPGYRESGSTKGLMQGYVYKDARYLYLPRRTQLDPFRAIFWGGLNKLLSDTIEAGLFKVVGTDRWQGLSTVILEYRFERDPREPNSHEVCGRIWVCPERSYLPVRRQLVVDGTVILDQGLFDLVELPNGVWYPRRIQSLADDFIGGERSPCWVLKIEEISIDPIPEGFFGFEFPAGTRVYDEVEGIDYTTY